MLTSRVLKFLPIFLAIAFVTSLGGKQAFANGAHGDNRSVNVKVLSFFLHHTYEYVQYSGPTGSVNGHFAFGGGTDGCSNCVRFPTSSVSSNAPHCIQVQGKLTYAITGVCHQGTNRALWSTPVPYVANWGGVGGSGLSLAAFCTFGKAILCYGPPC
jgi:hypothetical protein